MKPKNAGVVVLTKDGVFVSVVLGRTSNDALCAAVATYVFPDMEFSDVSGMKPSFALSLLKEKGYDVNHFVLPVHGTNTVTGATV